MATLGAGPSCERTGAGPDDGVPVTCRDSVGGFLLAALAAGETLLLLMAFRSAAVGVLVGTDFVGEGGGGGRFRVARRSEGGEVVVVVVGAVVVPRRERLALELAAVAAAAAWRGFLPLSLVVERDLAILASLLVAIWKWNGFH